MKAVESILAFSFLIFFGACIEEDLSPPPENLNTFPLVDQALWPFFESFEEEASARGFKVDLAAARIEGVIEEVHEANIAGSCSYNQRRTDREIVIDKSFWQRASPLYKEYIVFHELGHCYLFRDHVEACRPNRTYFSLMRSGNGDCFDNYTSQTRDYYVNELFSVLEGP